MHTGFVIGDRGLGGSGDSHPDWMMGHATAGDWLVVGGSAVGKLHLGRQLPRDDAFGARLAGPWLAIAVADGVGSRPYSRYGASLTVDVLTAYLLRSLVPPPGAVFPETAAPGSSADEDLELAPPKGPEEMSFNREKEGVQDRSAPPGAPGMVNSADSGKPSGTVEALKQRLMSGFIGRWSVSGSAASPEAKAEFEPNPAILPGSGSVPEGQTAAAGDSQDTGVVYPAGSLGWWRGPLGGVGRKHDTGAPDLLAIMRNAFDKTHLGLAAHARSLELESKDLGCTALALLVNVETGLGVVGQVGDGAWLGLAASGVVRELVEAEETDSPQSTYTLSRSDYGKHLMISLLASAADDPYVAYLGMTDGVSGDVLYAGGQEALEKWARGIDSNIRAAATPALAAAGMLNWLASYSVQGSFDDRTLVVVTRKERADGASEASAG